MEVYGRQKVRQEMQARQLYVREKLPLFDDGQVR